MTIFSIEDNPIKEAGFNALIQVIRTWSLVLCYVQPTVEVDGKYVGNRMSVNNVREMLTPAVCVDIPPSLSQKTGILTIATMNLSAQNLGDEGAKMSRTTSSTWRA